MSDSVSSVSDYLAKLSSIIKQYPDEIVVFRGEDQIFSKPCRPNIFRKESLSANDSFEKKLLDAMRQNKLSSDGEYLDNAIDAQHGEFPSRLLDVTYNSLIALYFAVTPFYHLEETANDDKSGSVYIFHFDKVYSPSSKNTQDCFKTIIARRDGVLSHNLLFSKNHKFIDHCKINKRIIAQQGAFILFQGDDAEGLPAYVYSSIEIPANSKSSIRSELNDMFGIHTGYVYPEITNLANELSYKCKKIDERQYSFKNEIEDIKSQFKLELQYYYDLLCSEPDNVELCRITEKVIFSYYIGILQLGDYLFEKCINDAARQNEYKDLIDVYNSEIQEFKVNILPYCRDGLNLSELLIEV